MPNRLPTLLLVHLLALRLVAQSGSKVQPPPPDPGLMTPVPPTVGRSVRKSHPPSARPEKDEGGGTFTNALGMHFVSIPAGAFTMGSEFGPADEKPRHEVRIRRSFSMQTTHVTRGQFQAFMTATGFRTDAERAGKAFIWTGKWEEKAGISWRNPGFDQGDDHPVVCVSWNDARAFLEWMNREERGMGYRLPTEAEWEYACRAGTSGERYGDLNELAWYGGNSGLKTHPASQKRANAWGLYDMQGQAWQWCEDWYGKAYYAQSAGTDPEGPPSGQTRVLRGGSWFNPSTFLRSACRRGYGPDCRSSVSGFRVVASRRAPRLLAFPFAGAARKP